MVNGTFTGVVTLIGAGVVMNGRTTSSVIEIGEHTLRNIGYDDYIGTYLEKALESGEPVTIAVVSRSVAKWTHIIGIKMNGKKYYLGSYDELGKVKMISGMAWVMIVVLGLLTFGMGGLALFLILKYKEYKFNAPYKPVVEAFNRA